MKILLKNKTYGLCKSCQNCEFYSIYSNGIWCEFPFGEIHWFGKEKIHSINQNDIFNI